MIRDLLNKLYQAQSLSIAESQQLFAQVMQGLLTPVELTAVLISMKVRGEAETEIAGAALAALQYATKFPAVDADFADIVGTGGDNSNSINISSTVALVAAAMGFKVAKHGNRSISSQSGSADVLASLGIDINLTPEQAQQMLLQHNFCFLFAPNYHAGFKYAAEVRTQLKTRTIFNVLGPLINPARPKKIMLGVYHVDLIQPMINTLKLLNYTHALVVHGDSLDEVAIHGVTQVAELKDGKISHYQLDPVALGLNYHPLAEIQGGNAEYNAKIIEKITQGHGTLAQKSAIALNLALLMQLFAKPDLQQNIHEVMQVLATDQVYQFLQQLRNK